MRLRKIKLYTSKRHGLLDGCCEPMSRLLFQIPTSLLCTTLRPHRYKEENFICRLFPSRHPIHAYFWPLFMCGVCIVAVISPVSKFGPSWHLLKPFNHWGNNSFHVLKGLLPTPRQVDLYPCPTLTTKQPVSDSCGIPPLTTSLACCFLPLNLNPGLFLIYFLTWYAHINC